MRTVVRRLVLRVTVDRAFAACLELLRTPDPRRGVIARRCNPDPPVQGGEVVSTVAVRDGERRVDATIVVLDPPHRLATQSGVEGGTGVRTALSCEPRSDGETLITLRSDAASGLPLFGRAGRIVDSLLLGGSQRRAARATLRRLRELAEEG